MDSNITTSSQTDLPAILSEYDMKSSYRTTDKGDNEKTDDNASTDLEAQKIILPMKDLPPDCILTELQTYANSDPNLISWDSPSDPANPLNWPLWHRWTLIILVSCVTFMSSLSSSMFAPGIPALMAEFHSSNSITSSFVLTIFVLGLAAGPLVFAPLSELYGRLPVQHIGSVGLVAFTIGCAMATRLDILIGLRLLQGIFGAVPLTNGGGLIADMIKQEERGFALAIFTVGVLLGPVVGPVAGGFLAAAKGWRWVFWIIAIVQGSLTLISFAVWRESYSPVLLSRKAALLRKRTGNAALYTRYDTGLSTRAHFKRGILRVFKMLAFSPIVLALSIHMGLVYSYLYVLLTTLTPMFENIYHFSPKISGLSYLGIGVGFLLGQMIFAQSSDRILRQLTTKRGGEMKPEFRLPITIMGGFFVPIGFFWYGWSAQRQTQWIVPIVGTGIAALGNALIFMSIQVYSIDAFTIYAASALAANSVTRSVMAAVLPLAAPKMYSTLGIGWGNSLLAFLALAMIPIPWLLFVHGEKMRGWNAQRIKRL